ncbi:S-adenosyl-L-methionine-dependent methyltransferase [Xylariaceae sp. FL0016]|nr:S-adenosyl-L-methionine-dependent methyltransferase [Xylariaceae sp. FL0016]
MAATPPPLDTAASPEATVSASNTAPETTGTGTGTASPPPVVASASASAPTPAAAETTTSTAVAGPSTTAHTIAAPATPAHWTQLQNDDDDDGFDDGDSALGNDAASTTASLSASILEYRTLHGRSYHSLQGTAEHWAPNDDAHLENITASPYFWRTNSSLHRLLKTRKRYWTSEQGQVYGQCMVYPVMTVVSTINLEIRDFADAYPNIEVIGTDISPSQPEWVPPNLKFEIEDCTQEWTFQPNSFDYIHMRYLFGSIQDWDELFRQAYRACKPGGWIEVHEPSVVMASDDGSVAPGSALYDWGICFQSAAAKIGRSMRVIEDNLLVDGITKAGFTNMVERKIKLPSTPWPRDERLKQVGAFSRLAMEQDLDGYAMFLFTEALGWSREQVTVFMARVRKELHDLRKKPYFMTQVVYARKPE